MRSSKIGVSGIEWNEFIHQLNYHRTFEQFNTIDDALLQVEVDPNTGDTLNSVLEPLKCSLWHNGVSSITIDCVQSPFHWNGKTNGR